MVKLTSAMLKQDFDIVQGDEASAAQLWKEWMDKSSNKEYTLIQALPGNSDYDSDKFNATPEIDKYTTWMEKLFMQGDSFDSFTFVHKKDKSPHATIFRGILSTPKFLLWAGLNGMFHRRVRRTPDPNDERRTVVRFPNGISREQFNRFYSTISSINAAKDDITWTSNPKEPNRPVPSGMPESFNDVGFEEEYINWLMTHYPSLRKYKEIENMLDRLDVTYHFDRSKQDQLDSLQGLAEYEGWANALGEWTLERWPDFWHMGIAGNKREVAPFFADNNFEIIAQKDNKEADKLYAFYTRKSIQVPEIVKEVLEWLRDYSGTQGIQIRPPNGQEITKAFEILRKERKMEKWETILKLTTQNLTEKTLHDIKNTHPSVFISEIKPEDMKATIMQMKQDAERYLMTNDNLEIRRISMVLDNMLRETEQLEEFV